MMKIYDPDIWVVVKISNTLADNPTVIYKILAGWYGGFDVGDRWQLNGGIVKIVEDGIYIVHGYSGSIYRCPKDCERTNMLTQSIFESLKSNYNNKNIEVNIVSMNSIKEKFK